MSSAIDHDLPPLGERTPPPARKPHSGARRNAALVAALALVVGLAAGFALGRALDDGSGDRDASARAGDSRSGTTVPAETEDTLPDECVATMRSAQQTLALLDQGLRDLRSLNLAEVERAAGEVQQLRGTLEQEVRRCLERFGD